MILKKRVIISRSLNIYLKILWRLERTNSRFFPSENTLWVVESTDNGAKSFTLHSRRRSWKIEATRMMWCTLTTTAQYRRGDSRGFAVPRPDGSSARSVCIIFLRPARRLNSTIPRFPRARPSSSCSRGLPVPGFNRVPH